MKTSNFKVYDLAESFALKEKLTKKSLLQMDTTNQSWAVFRNHEAKP